MNKKHYHYTAVALIFAAQSASAAIALDRTRIIVNEGVDSESVNITNRSKELPFLAQAWVDDDQGGKSNHYFIALPPIQRLEPGASSQVKIKAMPGVNSLPQDRESIFYFNLREIPPKSKKANTMQIALQTRIKLFYRPKAIVPDNDKIEQGLAKDIFLQRQESAGYIVNNPTPYFITIVDAKASVTDNSGNFSPIMVAPKSQMPLGRNAGNGDTAPVLTVVDDYGGHPKLQFSCRQAKCTVSKILAK